MMNWGLIIKDSMWSRSVLAESIVRENYPRRIVVLPRNDEKSKSHIINFGRILKRSISRKYKDSKYGSNDIAKVDIYELLKSFDDDYITYSNDIDIHSNVNLSLISNHPEIKIWIVINCGILSIDKLPRQSKYINLHQGYLPGTRGVDANYWPYITNKTLGVSSHYITKSIDGGNIICRIEIDKSLNVANHVHFSYIIAKYISQLAFLTIIMLIEEPHINIANRNIITDYYYTMNQSLKDIIIESNNNPILNTI